MKRTYVWIAQDDDKLCYLHTEKPKLMPIGKWISNEMSPWDSPLIGESLLTKKELERQPILCRLQKVKIDED